MTADEKQKKIAKVMGEFKRGDLKSSSGATVTDRRQALAIALSYNEDMGDEGLPGSFPGNMYEPYDFLMQTFFPTTRAKVFMTDDYIMNKSMVEGKSKFKKESLAAQGPVHYLDEDQRIYKNPTPEELREIPSWKFDAHARALASRNHDEIFVFDIGVMHRFAADILDVNTVEFISIQISDYSGLLVGGASDIDERRTDAQMMRALEKNSWLRENFSGAKVRFQYSGAERILNSEDHQEEKHPKKILAYHGTPTEFEKFSVKYLGSANGKTPSNMKGFFFSSDKEVARSFGERLKTVELTMKFPKVLDARGKDYSEYKHKLNDILESLDSQYDGVIIRHYVDSMHEEPMESTQYIVFSPSQIRVINSEVHQEARREFGCLMAKLDAPELKRFQDLVPDDQVYDEPTFGREEQPHVTLMWGFTSDADLPELKADIGARLPIEIRCDRISSFRNPDTPYDVLILEVEAHEQLFALHDHLVSAYDNEQTHKDYKPHITIAYVKKGFGVDLEGPLDEPLVMTSAVCDYSGIDNTHTDLAFGSQKNESRYFPAVRLERQDKQYTDETQRMFQTILDFLNANVKVEDEGGLQTTWNTPEGFHEDRPGVWVLDYNAIDPSVKLPLRIIFTNRTAEHSGFGFSKDKKTVFIVLNGVLHKSGTPIYLAGRFSGLRREFDHEAIHYLDTVRKKGAVKPSSAKAFGDNEDWGAYYNNPAELNAFFQEYAAEVRRLAQYPEYVDYKGWATPAGLIADFKKDTNGKDMWAELTAANRKRVEKRLYDLWNSVFNKTESRMFPQVHQEEDNTIDSPKHGEKAELEHREVVGTLNLGDRVVTVVRVRGEEVREKCYPDFVMGGNWAIYDFIPENEIWIEDMKYSADEVQTFVHELTESLQMLYNHETYDSAHTFALDAEALVRRLGGAEDSIIEESIDFQAMDVEKEKALREASEYLLNNHSNRAEIGKMEYEDRKYFPGIFDGEAPQRRHNHLLDRKRFLQWISNINRLAGVPVFETIERRDSLSTSSTYVTIMGLHSGVRAGVIRNDIEKKIRFADHAAGRISDADFSCDGDTASLDMLTEWTGETFGLKRFGLKWYGEQRLADVAAVPRKPREGQPGSDEPDPTNANLYNYRMDTLDGHNEDVEFDGDGDPDKVVLKNPGEAELDEYLQSWRRYGSLRCVVDIVTHDVYVGDDYGVMHSDIYPLMPREHQKIAGWVEQLSEFNFKDADSDENLGEAEMRAELESNTNIRKMGDFEFVHTAWTSTQRGESRMFPQVHQEWIIVDRDDRSILENPDLDEVKEVVGSFSGRTPTLRGLVNPRNGDIYIFDMGYLHNYAVEDLINKGVDTDGFVHIILDHGGKLWIKEESDGVPLTRKTLGDINDVLRRNSHLQDLGLTRDIAEAEDYNAESFRRKIENRDESRDSDFRTRGGDRVAIYKNPTQTEWEYFVSRDARGFIDRDGNLYFEGSDEENSGNYSLTTHDEIIKDLSYSLDYLDENYVNFYFQRDYAGDELQYGIAVQRYRESDEVYIAESIENFDAENVAKLFAMAKKNCGWLEFQAHVYNFESRMESQDDDETRIYVNPNSDELQEIPSWRRGRTLRGIIDTTSGDVFVSDPYHTVHGDLYAEAGARLGADDSVFNFMIDRGGLVVTYAYGDVDRVADMEAIKSNPVIRNMELSDFRFDQVFGESRKEKSPNDDILAGLAHQPVIDSRELLPVFENIEMSGDQEYKSREMRKLNRWLNARKTDNTKKSMILYHGTSADIDVMHQGLLQTSAKRRRSLQSGSGYVYLSVYPEMARTFAEMGYPGKPVSVYGVEVQFKDLKADSDQLRNKRMWAEVDAGASLADSLVIGHGARVRGQVWPYQIKPWDGKSRTESRHQFFPQVRTEDRTYLEFTKTDLLKGVDGGFRHNDVHYKYLKFRNAKSGIKIKAVYPKYVEFLNKSAEHSGAERGKDKDGGDAGWWREAGGNYLNTLFFSDGVAYLQKNFKFKDYDVSQEADQKALVDDVRDYFTDFIDNGDIRVFCSCPDYLYAGYKYIGTEIDYNDKNRPELRFPKRNNKDARGVMCKHLRLLMNRLDDTKFKTDVVDRVVEKFLQAEIARRYSHTKLKPDWYKKWLSGAAVPAETPKKIEPEKKAPEKKIPEKKVEPKVEPEKKSPEKKVPEKKVAPAPQKGILGKSKTPEKKTPEKKK